MWTSGRCPQARCGRRNEHASALIQWLAFLRGGIDLAIARASHNKQGNRAMKELGVITAVCLAANLAACSGGVGTADSGVLLTQSAEDKGFICSMIGGG